MDDKCYCTTCDNPMTHMAGSGVNAQYYCSDCGYNLEEAHDRHADRPNYVAMTYDDVIQYHKDIMMDSETLGLSLNVSDLSKLTKFELIQSCEYVRKAILDADFNRYAG